MISITKNEIIDAMSNISKITESVVYNPDIPIKQFILQNYYFCDDIGKKVKFDFQIYALMVDLRIISFLEDSFLDLIDNQELGIDDIKNRIFVNACDSNRFSNKQIFKYIRNAVSHSNSSKELFKVSPNGRFVEIDLKNTKPIPFHVKIDYRDLEQMINIISKKAVGKYISYVNRKDNCIYRLYLKIFPNSKDVYNRFSLDTNYVYDYDQAFEKFIDYCDTNHIEYEIKKYNLTDDQIDLLNKYKESAKIYDDKDKGYIDAFLTVFLNMIIPLGQEKICYLKAHLDVLTCLFKYQEMTFNQIRNEIDKGLIENAENNVELSELARHFCGNDILTMADVILAMREYLLENETVIQLLTFYYSSCFENEYLDIDGEIISRENLRNSLVHGRWYDDSQKNIVCFDTENGKNNDYNFYWQKKISLKNLLKFVVDVKNNSNKLK